MATKFLNLQLITSRRFRPGSGHEDDSDDRRLKVKKKQREENEEKDFTPPESPAPVPPPEPPPVPGKEAEPQPAVSDRLEPRTEDPADERNAPAATSSPAGEPLPRDDGAQTAIRSGRQHRHAELAPPAKPGEETDDRPLEATRPPPAPRSEAEPAAAAGQPAPPPEPQPRQRLEHILAFESDSAQQTAKNRELNELKKHRRELMRQLHELRTAIDQECESLQSRGHFFSVLLQDLQNFPDEVDESALRGLRQAVTNAHIECLKYEQEKQDKTVTDRRNPDDRPLPLHTLNFIQLSRIGAAMLWPLMAALLAAGGMIALSLYLIFRI